MKLKNIPSCADESERAVRVENYVKNSPKIITTLPEMLQRAPRAKNKNTQNMHSQRARQGLFSPEKG